MQATSVAGNLSISLSEHLCACKQCNTVSTTLCSVVNVQMQYIVHLICMCSRHWPPWRLTPSRLVLQVMRLLRQQIANPPTSGYASGNLLDGRNSSVGGVRCLFGRN